MKMKKIYSDIVFILGVFLIIVTSTSNLLLTDKLIIMLFGLNFMILSTIYENQLKEGT